MTEFGKSVKTANPTSPPPNINMGGESSSSSTRLHMLHPTESFPSNNLNIMMMMMMGHHHHRPILSSPNGGDDDGGPNQNDSRANKVVDQPSTRTTNSLVRGDDVGVSNIISWSESGASASASSAIAGGAVTAFDSRLSYKSPGGGGMAAAAAAALRYPFTEAQWKELERQAIIYKYMMAAIPVPSHLLLPAPPTTAPPSLAGNNNVRYGGIRDVDAEAGRCKRTDGKKWRCSRDVAPHQKYCERHMHRGRPRSRKPVEHHSPNNNTKKSRLQSSLTPTNNNSSPPFLATTTQPKPAPNILDASSSCPDIFSSSTYEEPNRMLGWAMEGEAAAADRAEQPWLHLMDTKTGVPVQASTYGTHDPSILQASYGEETLNLFSYTDFGAANIHNPSDQCQLFLNSDLVSSNHPPANQHCTSRGFIDACSNGDLKTIEESTLPSSEDNNLSPSSLTLSMAMVAGNCLDEGMRLEPDFDRHVPKDGPDSWLPFNSGGPLAEVLQPSSIGSGSNPASPYTSCKNGDSADSPATAALSPNGILHRALMFPHSDSSVCNSPTLAASTAAPEFVAFQWLS